MSEASKPEFPFESLGKQLKRLREQRSKSLAEVSGAVEIEVDDLGSFEHGKIRPSEEILNLLINYFDVTDVEAEKLWESAGYSKNLHSHTWPADEQDIKQTVVVLPQETRIIYSDMVHANANNFGVVLNFMQTNGGDNRPLVISRLGMSKEHAKSLIEVLQKTLVSSTPKQLPSSSKNKSQKQHPKND